MQTHHRGCRFLVFVALSVFTAMGANAESTAKLDTRQINVARQDYARSVEQRDQALLKLRRVADSALSSAMKSKQSAASVAPLQNLVKALQQYQSGMKASVKPAAPESLKNVGAALDKFFGTAAPAEIKQIEPHARVLADAQVIAGKSFRSMLKTYHDATEKAAEAAGAKKGQPIIIARRSTTASTAPTRPVKAAEEKAEGKKAATAIQKGKAGSTGSSKGSYQTDSKGKNVGMDNSVNAHANNGNGTSSNANPNATANAQGNAHAYGHGKGNAEGGDNDNQVTTGTPVSSDTPVTTATGADTGGTTGTGVSTATAVSTGTGVSAGTSNNPDEEEITVYSSITSVSTINPAHTIEPIIQITTVDTGITVADLRAATTQMQFASPNLSPVVLVVSGADTGPAIDLFTFAATVGTYDNILVEYTPCEDMLPGITIDRTEAMGYAGMLSAAGLRNPCAESDDDDNNNDEGNPNCRVCFYEHMNYGGDKYCTDDASGDFRDHDINDKITSVQIFNNECPDAGVVLYENDNNGGWRLQLSGNSRNIGDRYNDKATSFTFSGDMARNIASASNCKATLYEHQRYGGKSVQLDPSRTEITHLKRHDLNDKTTSIRVDFSGCPGTVLYVYEHDDHKGTRWQYTGSSGNIGEARNDKITSAKLVLR